MVTRRRFLLGMAGILAAAKAPAIVSSGNIMRINPDHIVVPSSGCITNFAQLTDEEKAMWSSAMWRQARKQGFIHAFLSRESI